MALLGGSRGFVLGFTIGLGTGFLGRDIIENPRQRLTPVVKIAIRMGIRVTEVSREWLGHFGEVLQDSYAEVKEDLKEAAREAQTKISQKNRSEIKLKSRDQTHEQPKKQAKEQAKEQEGKKAKLKKKPSEAAVADNVIHLDEQRQNEQRQNS